MSDTQQTLIEFTIGVLVDGPCTQERIWEAEEILMEDARSVCVFYTRAYRVDGTKSAKLREKAEACRRTQKRTHVMKQLASSFGKRGGDD